MSFPGSIHRFVVNTIEAQDKIARAAALDLFTGVVRSTPVDTGRARGNYQTKVGAPATNTIERNDKSGNAAVGDINANVPDGSGQEVFLSNNLDYIGDLENGSSRQAPNGMVRVNFSRVLKIVEEAVRKHKA